MDKLDRHNNIKSLEKKKIKLLTEMGIMAYQKIRLEVIVDKDFEEISKEIIEIDKLIYDENLELDKINDLNLKKQCICGNEVSHLDKFCSTCGENVENEIKEVIICETCNSKIDIDSSFCVCCGNKVLI
ncbi:MAG: double zinc ribbon domain-containing protein [Peptostreptococcaceae bacterium]